MGKKNRARTSVAVLEPFEERGVTLVGPQNVSISDPALAAWLGLYSASGQTDVSSLSIPAFWRCVQVIAGTIAGLPLKTYEEGPNGRERVESFLDNPAGPYSRGGVTPFLWKEWVVGYLLCRGEAFLEHVYNGGGGLIGLLPVSPAIVEPHWTSGADKVFDVQRKTLERFDSSSMTQVMGFTTDGLRGESPLTLFRRTAQTTVAGEEAARNSFKGALISGLVSADEDIDNDEAEAIKAGLDAKLTGTQNTNAIAFVNRKLKFSPWTMSAQDAQFLESRSFQVEEWARIFGVPTSLLSVAGAVSNWGTGVAESYLGLQKFTFMSWTSRVEEALTTLLPEGQWCEFDYSGLLQGTPAEEIDLLIRQVDAGLLTIDEARAIRNLPPLPKAPAVTAPTTPGAPA